MIFRRVKAHVAKEDWFAVFIDFIIVVFGVFMGLQVQQWNETRDNRAEYVRALHRLNIETTTNLAALDALNTGSELAIKEVGHAFDILQSCADSVENRKTVSDGIMQILGTRGIHLRRTALEDLTTNSRLLAQQSTLERQRFTDMLFYFNLLTREAGYAEIIPLDERAQNNPIISIGKREGRGGEYFGANFSTTRRNLILNVSIDEACKNDQLLKSFYTWERWQSYIPTFSRQLQKELRVTQSQLQARKK